MTVPAALTAYQGFDALFHATEGYIAKISNPMSDLYALKSIELIAKNLAKAVNDGKDTEARAHVNMKIAFYSTKPYDRIWFEPLSKEYQFDIEFYEFPCNEKTVSFASGFDAICTFVNDYITKEMVESLYEMGVKGILLRCAGFNQVDIKAVDGKLAVLRVPSYSPEAVAEFAMALLLSVNRFTHKAYGRTRDFNMSIHGLMARDLNNKIACIVGTGKIGQ